MGLKRGGAFLSSKLLRSKSYPISGIPSGVTELEEEEKVIFPKTSFSCPPPRSFQPYENPLFVATTLNPTVPDETTFTVKGGYATEGGGTLISTGRLITNRLDLTGGKTLYEHPLFYFSGSRFFPRIYKTDQPIVSMTAGWQDAFFHWIYQVLPRLELVDSSQTLYIAQGKPFQKETLEILGITNTIDASTYDAAFSPEITVPSMLGIPTPRSCAYLRSLFLDKIPKQEKRRLYISREDALTRQIVNDQDVWRLLHAYGYEKVTLTGLPLLEQMALFRSAESIISPHGAGLSHLIWCDPKTSVIELFHQNYVNVCYWHVSANVNLDYYHLFDTSEATTQDPNITVDLKALRMTLDRCHR